MSLKDQILNARDIKTESVEVPEWSATVFLKVMTAGERERFEIRAAKDKSNIIPLLLAFTLCSEDGTPLFTEEEAPLLAAKSMAVLYRLQDIATRINKLSPSDVDAAEGE